MEAATLLKVVNAAATTISVISNLSEGFDSNARADYQAASLRQQTEAQARITEQQAAREREIAKAEERDYRRDQSLRFGQMRAAGGGSGVEITTGSPLLAAEDFLNETELQAMRIRKGGQTAAQRLRQQADLDRWAGMTQANLYEAVGDSARSRGYFRAGSSLLTGLGKMYN